MTSDGYSTILLPKIALTSNTVFIITVHYIFVFVSLLHWRIFAITDYFFRPKVLRKFSDVSLCLQFRCGARSHTSFLFMPVSESSLRWFAQINFRRYSNIWILSTVVENGYPSFIESLEDHFSVSCIDLGQLIYC